MSKLLVNAIQCPDGTVIESIYRHDFVSHTQEDGRTYAVDGGLDYRRVLFCDGEFIDLCVYDDDSHEVKRDRFTWGTYGKNGKDEFKRVKLKNMSNDHIQAIIDTQHHIARHVKQLLSDELAHRIENNIEIKD